MGIIVRKMKESTKVYFSGVGKRLKGLSEVLLDMTIPVAVEAAIEKACSVINVKLHEMYISTIMNSIITLGLNIAGMLVALFNPFGIVVSKYVAALFFFTSCVFFTFKMIKFLQNYGRTTLAIGKNIVTTRSVSSGIENYVYQQFPVVSLAYTGIEVAAYYLPALRKIPSIKATVRRIIQVFWKQVLVYVLVVLIYSIGVYWVAKPILLERFAGLKWYEVYFYPLYHFVLLYKIR
ncbi:MAG: hypothetical protein SPG48_08585 [Treponema sp.]|nr:hypothetical protein [Treponema sp.]